MQKYHVELLTDFSGYSPIQIIYKPQLVYYLHKLLFIFQVKSVSFLMALPLLVSSFTSLLHHWGFWWSRYFLKKERLSILLLKCNRLNELTSLSFISFMSCVSKSISPFYEVNMVQEPYPRWNIHTDSFSNKHVRKHLRNRIFMYSNCKQHWRLRKCVSRNLKQVKDDVSLLKSPSDVQKYTFIQLNM